VTARGNGFHKEKSELRGILWEKKSHPDTTEHTEARLRATLKRLKESFELLQPQSVRIGK